MNPEKKTAIFADGINFSKPTEGTPEWIKGKISVRVENFYAWAKQHVNQNGFVNLDLKKSKEKGTLYLQLNDWKPEIKKPNFSAGEVDPEQVVGNFEDTTTSPDENGRVIDTDSIPF